MVLERIISIRDAIKHPWRMFFIGGLISVICIFLAFLIFPSSVGLFTVFLITFAMTPFMFNLMVREEVETEDEIERKVKSNFFQRHVDVLKVYIAFFAGMVFALSVLFLVLPEKTVEKIFEDQIREIDIIRGRFVFTGPFQQIILNNIGVLVLCFLFAFLFGSGAIFILAWNASVLAAAIGLIAKNFGGLAGMPVGVLTFLPHGSFEIVAYFIAGIAGGLISAAIIRKKSRWFWIVVQDSFKLIGVAALLLIVGALIESAIISF